MLKIKTKKQQEKVESILGKTSIWFAKDEDDGLYVDDWISYDEMAEIVDYLRSVNQQDGTFEECWVAYGRKGSKKVAKERWSKLKESDKEKIKKHIPFYVKSNERKYLKDFERYISNRTFESVVEDNKTGQITYDPERESGEMGYTPNCGGALSWNGHFNCYIYMGMFMGFIPDGYTDENRPNGARIMLNNGRGYVVWSSELKKWEKE